MDTIQMQIWSRHVTINVES